MTYSDFVYFIQATRDIDGTVQSMESEFTYRSYLGVPGTLIKLWVWLFKQVVHVLGSHERFPQRLNDNEIYYIYENLLLSQFSNFLKGK